MNTVTQGNIGLIASCLEFNRQGYNVFTPLTENAPFDIVVELNGILKRVEVKSSTRRNKANTGWLVHIKQVRPNKNKNIINKFDNTKTDLLSVYIIPTNKVYIFESKDIKVKTELVVYD